MERGLRETVASSVVHGKVRDVLRGLKELPSDKDSQTLELEASVILDQSAKCLNIRKEKYRGTINKGKNFCNFKET